jgi:nucleoid-associated protein YejK
VSRNFYANLRVRYFVSFALVCVVAFFTQANVFGFSLEGQNAPRANSGTNWSGGPLRGWYELEFIPCRVVLQPGSNQVVQINFDHTKNSSIIKRGIQNLFYFSPTANVKISTPQLTGVNSQEDWYYTFTADVSGSTNGYVYYYARMCGGAHLFGGSSLDMFYPPLQIMKPGPAVGNPDLSVTKTGPSIVYAGATYTYTLTFSNSVSATATAVGVQLSDFLPDGTTYIDGSATGSPLVTNLNVIGNQLWWDIADMPRGSSGTISYQVSVPTTFTNGTTIKNYAQIESAQDDVNELDNIASVTSTVLKAPPVANDDMYSVSRNQTLTITGPGVLANDSDAAGFTLKSLLASNVDSGTLTLNTNGSFVYLPASNFVGTATFYYVATNGFAASSPAKVTINVLQLVAPSDPTVACASSVPAPATNLTQFVAQGGIASGPYCGQPTSVTFLGDSSNGGDGCPASPLIVTRIYQLTTGCGDTTNVVQIFTISDSTVPVITSFPPDATYSCSAEVPPANDSSVAKTDNCTGTVTVTHDADVITAGSCANRYTIARTYRVSDSCGNATSRTQHITVNDQTAPTITAFPADATYSCIDAVPAANNSLVTASDNCTGALTITHDTDTITSSNCVNRLTITRTYRVTDSCGNATSKTQTITVNGTQAPVIATFPANATYNCAESVPAADNSLVNATNACGGITGLTVTHLGDVITSSNCVNRFTITRTYIATDACGNSSSKAQVITVNGTTPPTIVTFPADATYSCANAVPAADNNLITATNSCGGIAGLSVTHDADVLTSSNCVNRLTIKRTYRLKDSCGNATSKTQTITVSGTTPPTITAFPADASYSCANSVPSANDNLVTATNACGGGAGVTITHAADVITASNCVNHFTITRTYIATDACGNATSKNQTITVNGTTPPTITSFPADQTVSCVDGVPPANNNLVSAIDNCGSTSNVTISHDADFVTSSNCVNRLTIARTYRVTDACGNLIKRTQTITVNGSTAPVITTFPADVTYSCATAVPAANNSLVQATNACGGTASITISHNADVITSSNCVNHFTITRTYIVTDACGNSASKNQTVVVDGTTPPTITTFPPDATYSCASGVPAANDSLVTAADNCGAASVIVTHDADLIISSNCVNRFTIQRTYHVTDACGNATSKTQKISVNGTTAPTIATFPADVTYSCASAVPAADNGLVTATDGCGASSGLVITHGADVVTSSNCVNRITIQRTYIATDACGNSSSKTQTITVNGTTAPTITTFPADATYSCANVVPAANDSLITATDNCGGVSVTITHDADRISESNCPNHFIISRIYHATDGCGNSISQTQTITVHDTTAPALRPPYLSNLVYSCAIEVPPANDSIINAVDNCGGGVIVTHEPDTIVSTNCVNRFTIRRVYHVSDFCGNSTNVVQTIRVEGTTAPTITAFPSDATYTCSSAVPAADDNLVTAIDGCGTGQVHISHGADAIASATCDNRYVIHRVYIAVDSCGNSSSKTQIITINNTTPPTITQFPADASYSCSGDVPTANNSLVSATNACGEKFGMVITHTADVITSSNCVNRFTIARTYLATDACGNSTSKTQTITVNATTPPTISTFPSDTTVSCVGAVPPPNDGLVIALDGCGSANPVITHSTDVITSSNCVNRFTVLRTYIATDACGNSASKTQKIVVNGTNAPVITAFPTDLTVDCSVSVPAADNSLVQAADTCGIASISVTHDNDVIVSNICVNHYIIARTYHVTDACGNATNRTQTITVNDTIAPTITCPPGFTVSHFEDIPSANGELVDATDNCSVPLKSYLGETAVTNNSIVTITRTFAATDECGNSSTCTQVITMNPFFGQPTARPDTYSVFENNTLNIAAPGVLANDTDPNNLPLQALLVSGPSHGTVMFYANGSFRYVPDTYYLGADTFTYQPSNGGNAPGAPVTVTITVNFVNQPPSFTKGPNQIVNNYDGTQTRANWAGDISPGPANESAQTVQFLVSNDNNSIFSVQPAINSSGTLTYTPAPNKFGTSVVSVVVKDNGGTANDGKDTSVMQMFSIIVNNPPSATINTPTNTSLFLYPAPVDITATATDLDGIVTNVTFFNGTNVIGQGTPTGNNKYNFTWTNAPASNSVLYALATDNYGATNLSTPINIQLGNPVNVTGGVVVFSPSLFSWGQKLSVTNPTISIVQSVTVTFTSIAPDGTSILGVTGTNSLGQPYITFNNTVPPVTGIDNYATILYVASTKPTVTFTTSASLSQGAGFTVDANTMVPISRRQFQNDGSFLLNFVSQTNRTYFVQYTSDFKQWFTSPVPLKGNGTQLQWVDVGPIVTVSAPRSAPYRFYRVVSQ